MGSVRDFFVSEAAECLAAIERLLDEAQGPVAADELLRHARTLRGSAQMAREDEVMTAARALEAAARAIGDGTIAWTPDAAQGVRDTVDDLRALVDGSEPDDERAGRIRRVIDRWRQPGVRLPEPPAHGPAGAATAFEHAGPSGGAEATPDAEIRARIEFHAYVAAEVSGILSTVEAALHRLERVPRDREPLKSILRRQRALLGSARLESLSEIAETLQSIDQVCRLIARRDVPVQGEWHDFFRAARDVLADAAARLMDGQSPAGSPALQRMIALRDALQAGDDAEVTVQVPPPPAIEQAASDVGDFFRSEARLLLERVQKLARELDGAAHDRQAAIRRELDATLSALRDTAGTFGYPNPASLAEAARLRARRGTGAELLALLPGLSDAVEATAGGATTAAPPPEAGQEDAVPVEELLYRGEAAIRRAHELRPTLERAIAGDPAARDALDELYDLLDRIRS